MAGKTKFLFASALVIALVGFTVFILTHSKERYTNIQQLPDGSWLKVDGVQLSTGGHSFAAKSVTGWRAKMARVLPRNWTQHLGWLTMGGSMTIGGWGLVKGTNVGLFTIHEGTNWNGFTFTRLEVFDEMGNSFDGGTSMGTLSTSDGKNELRVDGWVPPAFPRRGKTLGLRYFVQQGGHWTQVAEFRVPNPAAGNYPTWTPEPLPATKTNGDLTVTLESLRSGLSNTDENRAARSNEVARTELVLRTLQSGHATNAWRPIAVEISDATGNDWTPYPHVVSVRRDGDADRFSFRGALWPGEASWKMKFEFSRVADFLPEETCTFIGILVPGATQVIDLDNTTNIGGSTLRLKAISGVKAEQPGNLKWSTIKDRVNISVSLDPTPSGQRLTLLKVEDQNGGEVRFSQDADWGSPERICALMVPEGAKQLNFTFAFHKSRFVEFMAKP